MLSTLMLAFALTLQPMYGLVAGQVANAAPAPTIYVNQATGGDAADDKIYTTINEALTEADAGDVISVAAGTYNESFNISKSITLAGAGQGQTIIATPATLANNKDLFAISGSGVSVAVSDLTIDAVSDKYTSNSAAVHVYAGANAVFDNIEVKEAHKSVVDKTYIYGILVGSSNSVGTAVITNSTVSNYGRGGVYVFGNGSFATIHGNVIKAETGFPGLLNGISVQYGANADIQGNTITGNWYAGAGWSGAGITVWDNATAATVIRNNTVTNNETGIGIVTDSPAVLTNLDTVGATGNGTNARLDSPSPKFSTWGIWPWSAAPSTTYVNSSDISDKYDIVMADGRAVVKGYNLFSNAQDAVDVVATGGTVKLLRDLHVTAPILIKKALTFDGNGLSVVSSFSSGATSPASGIIQVEGVSDGVVRFVANNNKAFRVHGQGSAIIDGPGNYNGLHGINVYNSNVELNRVILSNNGKSGLNIGRNSNATVNDITTLNNTWYGINVDKTSSGSYSTLTVNGTSTHSEGNKPHIFSDSRDNVDDGLVGVNDSNLQYVRYWDGNGYKWVLDLEKPNISLSADSFNPASFTVQASDDQGLDTIGYSIWKDGVRIGVWGQGKIDWDDKKSFSETKTTYKLSADEKYHQLSDLEDGSYKIYANATDARGKSTEASAVTFLVDHKKPTVSVDIGSINPASFTLEAKDTSGVASVTAILRRTAAANGTEVATSCTKTMNAEGLTTFTVVCDIPTGLADDTYNIRFNAIDVAGNFMPSQQVNFAVDNTNPTVVVAMSDIDLTVGDTVTVTIDASDAISGIDYVQYKVMNLDDTTAAGWFTIDNNTATDAPAISGLAPGSYILRARAFDNAGNKKSGADVAFTVSEAVVDGGETGETPDETGGTDTPDDGNNNSGNEGNGNDGTGGESIGTEDDDEQIQPFTAPVFGFAFQPFTNDNTAQNDNEDENTNETDDNGDVAGVQDQAGTPLTDTGEVLGLMDHKWFGIAWYWYLVILGGLVGAWLMLAAAIRRNREEEA